MNAFTGALCGAAIGLGVFLILIAFRPDAESPQRSTIFSGWATRIDRLALRSVLAVAGAAVGLSTGWPVMVLLGALGGFAAPSLVGRRAARVRTVERTEALAGWTESLRDLITAGSAIESTIAESARVAPAPIRVEVRALAARLGNNEDFDAALHAFADELDDPLADLVVIALATAASRQGGSKLTDVLAAAAATARAQVALRHQVEAARAATYTSARVVVAVFVLFAGGLFVLNRSFLEPFGTPVGQMVLLGISALFAVCAVSMAHLAEPERSPRLLALEHRESAR